MHDNCISIANTPPSWKKSLSQCIQDVEALLKILHLSENDVDLSPHFPLKVPLEYVAKIKKGDPTDPLLLQILSQQAENIMQPGYSKDPLEEKTAQKLPGLFQKYPHRALLTLTSTCGIHCRYCFRRHFPYEQNTPSSADLNRIFEYLSHHSDINEIILSGGDPLVISDKRLEFVFESLEKIPSITRVRIHSRLLGLLPSRVTTAFQDLIKKTSLQVILVTHLNHPHEIDDNLALAMHSLKQCGATILNQSVLLKNVNDEVQVLQALSEKLFKCSILPYYLHCLDKVAGAHAFDIPLSKAKEIAWQLRQCLPGFLVPQLVREVPGYRCKVPMDIVSYEE